MAVKRVIAYAMHETERDAAAEIVDNAQTTDSYVIGDVEEDRIVELERAGLVVDQAHGRWLVQVFARNLLRPPRDYALVVFGALASDFRRAPGR